MYLLVVSREERNIIPCSLIARAERKLKSQHVSVLNRLQLSSRDRNLLPVCKSQCCVCKGSCFRLLSYVLDWHFYLQGYHLVRGMTRWRRGVEGKQKDPSLLLHSASNTVSM